MTFLGALVAFGLLFLGVSLGLSLLLNVLLFVFRKTLRRQGAWVERQAAQAALVLPPLLSVAVTAVLAVQSKLALAAGADHCLAHDHHLHLCVQHNAPWLAQPWALALVAAAVSFLVVRFGLAALAHVHAQRAATRLRGLGTPLAEHCYLVPSDAQFAFTAGLAAPAVIISTSAWAALTPDERAAVLAHELAHLAHGDLWRRALLGLAASLGVPVLAARALRLWELSSERVCDRRAVAAVGRPSTVASAILALMRQPPSSLAPAGAAFAAASHVPERVESLLLEEGGGERDAHRLARLLLAASLALGGVSAVFAEPLHHLFETLLG